MTSLDTRFRIYLREARVLFESNSDPGEKIIIKLMTMSTMTTLNKI